MYHLILTVALAAADSSKPFVSQEGSFSVRFPSDPSYDTLTVPTPEGPQVRRVFRYSDDEVVYFLVHTCMPPPTLPSEPEVTLTMGRDSGLQMAGGILVSEKSVSVGRHRGRRLVETIPGAGIAYALIVLGDHGTYYSLGAAPRSAKVTKKAEAFLDSFKVLPPTDKAWCKTR
jgi:hypothetical protein